MAAAAAFLGSSASCSACVHHGLAFHEAAARTRLALAHRYAHHKTKGSVGATRFFPRRVTGVAGWEHGFGATPAERRPAGAQDAVLVPLNPCIPGIRPSTGAPVCRTHSTKSVAATAAVVVLAGSVMIE